MSSPWRPSRKRMISRSWPNGFARVCVISCTAWLAGAHAQQKPPAMARVDPGEAAQWQTWTHDAGWQVIAPDAAANAGTDQRVLALIAKVEAAIKSGAIDPARVYLAGRGEAVPIVFYTIARAPDLWAAAAAIGGSPKAAIDSGRMFSVNFTNVP